MATKLFVNLPVKDLNRSKAFFTGLGLAFFGQALDRQVDEQFVGHGQFLLG